MKTMSNKEVEKMLLMAQVMFPTESDCIKDVEVVK